MGNALNFKFLSAGHLAVGRLSIARTVLQYVYVWCCLVKLPATGFRDSPPQTWEAVLSYGLAHHLQWGRDIVFTFGPLGFLTSDYYWGNFFWPIVTWAGLFALVTTTALVPLMRRLPRALRFSLYAGLPLLTVPACFDLGFDPIHFLSVTVLGIACLPGERPTMLRLITTAFIFSVLSLIKFTFCIYSIYTIAVIVAANRNRLPGSSAILVGSSFILFLAFWWATDQDLGNMFSYLQRSVQMAAGYSGAMGLAATRNDSTMGIALLSLLFGSVFTAWLGSSNWRGRTDRVAITAAGIFLAWKEGFVRADAHVVVFFLYSFFLSALLPALLGFEIADHPARSESDGALADHPLLESFRRRVLAFSAGCMVLSLAPFVLYKNAFKSAVREGLLARNRDTFNAFLRPTVFRFDLERQLDAMRREANLPGIRAMAGSDTIGVMNLDQDAAILNGLNYVPHPVYQSYSAYTAKLQRLNTEFYKSEQAPQYLLWHAGSIDGRFPTLDEGEALLTVFSGYSPVVREKKFILWKRNSANKKTCCRVNERECLSSMDQWIPIPTEPTWLRIDCKQTFPGKLQSLLWRCSELRLEIQLDDSQILNYRLLPEKARDGFLINPFLYSNDQLIGAARATAVSVEGGTSSINSESQSPKIIAARVRAANQFAFARPVRFVAQTVQGIWPIGGESGAAESKEISKAQ